MTEREKITVEVAYALPHKQAILEVEVDNGTTVLEAARLSGISEKFDGIDFENARFGIFGKVVAPEQTLDKGDRIEIYRPLIADPKEVRKQRAARARAARAKERRAGGDKR